MTARVIVVTAVAVAMLRDAHALPTGAPGAQPSASRVLPPRWHELPSVARAVTDALPGTAVDRAEAWGDPAAGCFAAEVSLHGAARDADVVRGEVIGSLRADPRLAGLALRDATVRGENLDVAFERAPYRGTLRATSGSDGHATLLACLWNEREPTTCSAACDQLLGGR
jgi:hypothetical protein